MRGEKFERVQIKKHYNLWAASYFLQLTFWILQIQFMSCKLKSYELLLRVFPSLSDFITSLEYLERLSATYPCHKKLKHFEAFEWVNANWFSVYLEFLQKIMDKMTKDHGYLCNRWFCIIFLNNQIISDLFGVFFLEGVTTLFLLSFFILILAN